MKRKKIITIFAVGGTNEPAGIKYVPMARAFIKRGYAVNCITSHPNLKSLEERVIDIDGLKIYYAGQMQVKREGNQKYYFNPLKLTWVILHTTIAMIIRGLKTPTDVIYCFKPQPINGFAALMVKFLKGKPLLLDVDDYEAELNKANPFLKVIITFFENTMPKFSEKVTYNTDFNRDRYLALGYPKEKFIYLQFTANPQHFTNLNQEKIETLKNKYALSDKKVVLYFGTLSLRSGHAIDILIKAFQKAQKQMPDTILLIVGGGEDYDALVQMAGHDLDKTIKFAGRVSPEEIPYYLALAYCSIDPVEESDTNKGRSPWKIFESLVSGVPVLTADVGDRKKYLDNEQAGLLVKAGSIDSLAEGLITLSQNEDRQQKMSAHCKKITQQWTWENTVENLINKIELLQN